MNKPNLDGFYIGLMSGTSLDGIDCALVDLRLENPLSKVSRTIPFSDGLLYQLKEITRSGSITLQQLGEVNANLAAEYAAAVEICLKASGTRPEDISAIGCHGQTVWHSPNTNPAYTIQLGDPGRLSALTNLTVVADFRSKDIALGGQGAPLAPAFHENVFRSDKYDRIILNLGGIANITLLPSDQTRNVLGFDTGPANTFLDYWTSRSTGMQFDRNGDWAASGEIDHNLLHSMISNEPYFDKTPPKTTGTEYFSHQWLNKFIQNSSIPAKNIQSTLVELTATTIAKDIKKLPARPQQCYVCGGGASNIFLLNRLRAQLPECEIATTSTLGIDPDFVEAIAFAWLAKQTLSGRPGNLPGVTNASRSAILGGIHWP